MKKPNLEETVMFQVAATKQKEIKKPNKNGKNRVF